MRIAVIGLGYVGLPLSLQFARSCVNVLGLDVDPGKVELLNNRQSYIKHVPQSAIAELVKSGKAFGIGQPQNFGPQIRESWRFTLIPH